MTRPHTVPGAGLLRRLVAPELTVALAALLLGVGALALLFPPGPVPEAGGLERAEHAALQAGGLHDLLGSTWVHLLALALALQILLALWARRFGLGGPLAERSAGVGVPGGGGAGGSGWRGLLGLAGLLLVLGAGLWGRAQAVRGELLLSPGETQETCRALVSGRPVDRFLGVQATLTRWDEQRQTGSLALKLPGGEPRSFPVGFGRPAALGDWRFVPLAARPDPRPAGIALSWQAHAGGAGGHATLRPGATVELGGGQGTLTWELFTRELAGQGPAVQVAHQAPDGAVDRRWLLLRGGDHERRHRQGPVALEVTGVEPAFRLVLRAERRLGAPLLWLGLALIALDALLAARASRKAGAWLAASSAGPSGAAATSRDCVAPAGGRG